MPNPFHDETGRFCSKEEMGDAVKRLEVALIDAPSKLGGLTQAVDSYFELRRDYEAASRKVVEIPEEWVANVSSSGLQNPLPNSAQGIEAIYRSGLNDELRKPSGFHTYKALDLFTNEHTPQWIKDEIYREASVEIKVGMIEEFGKDDYLTGGSKYPEIISEDLLPFTWGDNGHHPEVTRALLASNHLGFDIKYELAKNRGQLGYLIAVTGTKSEAKFYAAIPDLERDLKLEWKNPLRTREARDTAANVLARNSADEELRLELRGRDGGAVVNGDSIPSALAQNVNLTEQEGVVLLAHSVSHDSQSFELVYSNLSRAQRGEDNPLTVGYRERVNRLKDTRSYRGANPSALNFAKDKVDTHYGAELDAAQEKYPGFNRESHEFTEKALGSVRAADYWHQLAVLDAQTDRYESLLKESKGLDKEHRTAARRDNRDAAREIFNEQQLLNGRLNRAKKVRISSIVLDQVVAERAALTAAV